MRHVKSHPRYVVLKTHFELLMRDMEAFLLMAMQESIAVRKEERSSTEVRFSTFPSGLNLLNERQRLYKYMFHELLDHLCMGILLCMVR